jgi:hypothetical protein
MIRGARARVRWLGSLTAWRIATLQRGNQDRWQDLPATSVCPSRSEWNQERPALRSARGQAAETDQASVVGGGW